MCSEETKKKGKFDFQNLILRSNKSRTATATFLVAVLEQFNFLQGGMKELSIRHNTLGSPKDGFNKQLLTVNQKEKLTRLPSPTASVTCQGSPYQQTQIQRTGRQPQKRSTVVQRPSFNTFLKERKGVSESKFRGRDSVSPIERTGRCYVQPSASAGHIGAFLKLCVSF